MKNNITSVIVPTKNRINDLKTLLYSLSHQTHLPNEIVVVNNSHTNIKKEMTETGAKTGLNIRIVDCHSDSIGAVRNCGIRHAKGDTLLFVDDDCVVPPNWVEEMSRFQKKKGAPYALVGTSFPMYPQNVYSAANNYFPLLYFESIIYADASRYFSAVIDSKNFGIQKKDLKGKLFIEERGLSRDDFLLSNDLRKKGWKFLIQQKSIVLHKGRTDFSGFFHWSFESGRKQYAYLKGMGDKRAFPPKAELYIRKKKKELIRRLTLHYSIPSYICFLGLISVFHPLAFYSGYLYELTKRTVRPNNRVHYTVSK